MGRTVRRGVLAAVIAFGAFAALVSVSLAQWPTACVDLNDVVELQLGNNQNAGIYQKVFLGADAERACQADHRADVRSTFAWAFDGADAVADLPSTAWPTTCVDLNDFVEAHLGNTGNVGIYQRAFGDGSAAESACRSDHRTDVQAVFDWAYGPPVARLQRLTLPGGQPLALEELADLVLSPPWAEALVALETLEDGRWISCGSGFIVTSDGYVVTNHHIIVDGPGWVDVQGFNGFLGRANVVATDPEHDLALLKLPYDGSPYSFLGFGASAELRIGDGVMIVGYPGCSTDLRLTASWGSVTALNVRDISRETGYSRQSFRSNAHSDTGSSGSPVLNRRGRVVGVHWGSGEKGSSQVVGDVTRQIIEQWIEEDLASVPVLDPLPAPTPPVPPPSPQPVPPATPGQTAAQAAAEALARFNEADAKHTNALNSHQQELARASQAAVWRDGTTVSSALRLAAGYLDTAAVELDAAASELNTVVTLIRDYSLPHAQWSFYLELAASDMRVAAAHLRNAAFYYRLVSSNLESPRSSGNLDAGDREVNSYLSFSASARSSIELWVMSVS